MNTEQFIKTINDTRLANKNQWYFWKGQVNGKDCELKGFNTSLQILRINGLNHPTICDISVKEFKNTLEEAANYAGA